MRSCAVVRQRRCLTAGRGRERAKSMGHRVLSRFVTAGPCRPAVESRVSCNGDAAPGVQNLHYLQRPPRPPPRASSSAFFDRMTGRVVPFRGVVRTAGTRTRRMRQPLA